MRPMDEPTVVGLDGREAGDAVDAVVEQLEALVARAKTGQIDGFAVALVNGTDVTTIYEQGDAPWVSLVGAAALLLSDLTTPVAHEFGDYDDAG